MRKKTQPSRQAGAKGTKASRARDAKVAASKPKRASRATKPVRNVPARKATTRPAPRKVSVKPKPTGSISKPTKPPRPKTTARRAVPVRKKAGAPQLAAPKPVRAKRKPPLRATGGKLRAARTRRLPAVLPEPSAPAGLPMAVAGPQAPSPSAGAPFVPEPAQPPISTPSALAKGSPAAAKTTQEPPPFRIPPILLEGDEPAESPISATVPSRGAQPDVGTEPVAFPGAATTVSLLARDPHWLYVHWDLAPGRQRLLNELSIDRHLVLRVHNTSRPGLPKEVHVHPESVHWFVHVELAAGRYYAELGYFDASRTWVLLATSPDAVTPPESLALEGETVFVPFDAMAELVRTNELPVAEIRPQPSPGTEWIEAPTETYVESEGEFFQPMERPAIIPSLQPEQVAGTPALPSHPSVASRPMGVPSAPGSTPQARTPVVSQRVVRQRSLLLRRVQQQLLRSEPANSAAIQELVSQVSQQQVSSAEWVVPAAPPSAPAQQALPGPQVTPGGLASWSEQGEEFPRPRQFWFNINAELVVYGATEPTATVRVAGRAIRLRQDGTFSYRFALPDGEYELCFVATSTDGDQRTAGLRFSRSTDYEGQVGAHPQDPALNPPLAERVP